MCVYIYIYIYMSFVILINSVYVNQCNNSRHSVNVGRLLLVSHLCYHVVNTNVYVYLISLLQGRIKFCAKK